MNISLLFFYIVAVCFMFYFFYYVPAQFLVFYILLPILFISFYPDKFSIFLLLLLFFSAFFFFITLNTILWFMSSPWYFHSFFIDKKDYLQETFYRFISKFQRYSLAYQFISFWHSITTFIKLLNLYVVCLHWVKRSLFNILYIIFCFTVNLKLHSR